MLDVGRSEIFVDEKVTNAVRKNFSDFNDFWLRLLYQKINKVNFKK